MTHPPSGMVAIPSRPVLGQWRYPKARFGARVGAYFIDHIVNLGPILLAWIFGTLFQLNVEKPAAMFINVIGAFAWMLYYGFTKDGRPNGQSIGKKMVGLMVVNVRTNRPCSVGESATRALIGGLLGMVPLFGAFIEPIVALARDDGRRLGDQAADTQVIEASDYEAMARRAG